MLETLERIARRSRSYATVTDTRPEVHKINVDLFLALISSDLVYLSRKKTRNITLHLLYNNWKVT